MLVVHGYAVINTVGILKATITRQLSHPVYSDSYLLLGDMGNNASTLMSCTGTTPKKKYTKSNITERSDPEHDSDSNHRAENPVTQEKESDVTSAEDGGITEPKRRQPSLNQSDTSPVETSTVPPGDAVIGVLDNHEDTSTDGPSNQGPGKQGQDNQRPGKQGPSKQGPGQQGPSKQGIPFVDEEENNDGRLSDVNSLSISDSNKNMDSRTCSLSHSPSLPNTQITQHHNQGAEVTAAEDNNLSNKAYQQHSNDDGEEGYCCSYHSNESLARYEVRSFWIYSVGLHILKSLFIILTKCSFILL